MRMRWIGTALLALAFGGEAAAQPAGRRPPAPQGMQQGDLPERAPEGSIGLVAGGLPWNAGNCTIRLYVANNTARTIRSLGGAVEIFFAPHDSVVRGFQLSFLDPGRQRYAELGGLPRCDANTRLVIRAIDGCDPEQSRDTRCEALFVPVFGRGGSTMPRLPVTLHLRDYVRERPTE